MSLRNQNLRKAAILIACLDTDDAERLLAQMSPGQAHLLREEAAALGPIDWLEQQEVLEEFFRIGPLVPTKHPSGIELDGRLPKYLALSSSDREMAISQSNVEYRTTPFRFLHEASAEALAPYLKREHPQTIAVVVSHLPAERAADVLAFLPTELQIDVARRLVDLDETDPEVLRDIEQGLESWLCDKVRVHRRRAAGMSTLSSILEAASPHARKHLLSHLTRHDRQLASRFEIDPPQTVSFGDLENWDRESLSSVVTEADAELLILALAGASREFTQRVLSILHPSDAAALRRSLADLGPTRLTDVEEAQRHLAELATQLQASGQVSVRERANLSVAV